MTNADLDRLLVPDKASAGSELWWKSIENESLTWRARDYAFLKDCDGTQLGLPFGDGITYHEQQADGKQIIATLDFGEWKDAIVEFYSLDGKPIKAPLKEAYGLGIVDIEKLKLVEMGYQVTGQAVIERPPPKPPPGQPPAKEQKPIRNIQYTYDKSIICCELTFGPDFNPKRDLAIIDIMRPDDWGHLGTLGFPMRLPVAGVDAWRYSLLPGRLQLSDSTGYHGSVVRSIWSGDGYDHGPIIGIGFPWLMPTGVAALDLAPSITEKLGIMIKKAESIADPEQLLRVATELEAKIAKLGPSLGSIQKRIRELKELAGGLDKIEGLPPLAPSLEPIQRMIRELKELGTRLSGITELPSSDAALEPIQKKIREVKELGAVLSGIEGLPPLAPILEPIQTGIRELKELATGLSAIAEVPPLVPEAPKPPPLVQQ